MTKNFWRFTFPVKLGTALGTSINKNGVDLWICWLFDNEIKATYPVSKEMRKG